MSEEPARTSFVEKVSLPVAMVPGNATPEDSCPSVATDSSGTVVARSRTEEALGAAV